MLKIQALPLYRAGDLGGTQTPGLLLFYFNLILSNLWTTLHIEPLTNTINTILCKSHTRPQKFWWCKILHCGHILAHKSRLQIVGFFLLKVLLDKSQGTQKLWIKRCKNMQSGHFLAHKPAFLNLLFNNDNFDFWFDS